MEKLPTTEVQRRIRALLPQAAFEPNGRRIGWLLLHITIVLCGFGVGWRFGETASGINWPLMLPLSVIIGLSFGGLSFVAHEALHGAITRRLWLRNWIGRIGFSPFCISPRLWMAWHNRTHHNHTNVAGSDPDAYPSLEEFQSNRAARLAVKIGAPQLGKWRGAITFILGFSIQSAQILLQAKIRGQLSGRHHRAALIESGLTALVWLALAWLVGPALFALLYVVPLIIANIIVMSYIVTNHSLSPLVDKDDPLASTLSVTVPRWYDLFSLQFGYHTEHHLFPTISHVHGPIIREQLLKIAPDHYQSMPLTTALGRIVRSPRVYKDKIFLFNPESGLLLATLGTADAPFSTSLSNDSVEELALHQTQDEISEIKLRAYLPQGSSPPPPAAPQAQHR